MRYARFTQTINGVTRGIIFDIDAVRVSHVIGEIDGKTSKIVMKDGSCYLVNGTSDEIIAKIQEASRSVKEPGVFDELLEKIRQDVKGQKLQAMPGPAQLVMRNAEDVKRIAELEADLHTARKALDFQVAERNKLEAKSAATEEECRKQQEYAESWCKRACAAEAEIRAMKKTIEAKGQDSPLNAWRILATALRLFNKFAEDENRLNRDRLEAKAAACAIDMFMEGTFHGEPYECNSL